MKLVFIGDIFGSTGRKAIAELLPAIKAEVEPDLVIANCENAAAGAGLTKKIYKDILSYGVDFLTSGNHIWNRPEIYSFISDKELKLIRPANYPQGTPGLGYAIFTTTKGQKVAILNLMGRVNLLNLNCPFRTADEAISEISAQTGHIVVDFHAETTSEKVALGWYLDGRVSAVIGTHTHVPTADGRVLPKGTAYITDAGMTGAMDSVIGLNKERVIQRFVSGLPVKFEQSKSNPGMDYVIIDLDDEGKALSIENNRRFLKGE